MLEIKTNVDAVVRDLNDLANKIRTGMPVLLDQIGKALVKDVQDRIQSADHGTWKPPSKWVRAKKGVEKALVGAEKFVFWRVAGLKLSVYGKTPGDWTLSMHDKGFENFEASADEIKNMDNGRVVLRLANPAALGVKTNEFRFIPKHAGTTPRRKIWATPEDAARIASPIAFRWISKTISEAHGVRP